MIHLMRIYKMEVIREVVFLLTDDTGKYMSLMPGFHREPNTLQKNTLAVKTLLRAELAENHYCQNLLMKCCVLNKKLQISSVILIANHCSMQYTL